MKKLTPRQIAEVVQNARDAIRAKKADYLDRTVVAQAAEIERLRVIERCFADLKAGVLTQLRALGLQVAELRTKR